MDKQNMERRNVNTIRKENEVGSKVPEKNITARHYEITGVPTTNVIPKEDFQNRVSLVFKELGNILKKSFGAYGAPTFISNLSDTTVTKDGYTIAKNVRLDKVKGSTIDHIIYKMAMEICERLNYKVGDGTTTAIVATNAVYDAFVNNMEMLRRYGFRPKDIMERMHIVAKELCDRITKASTPVSRDNDELANDIRKIVDISSNGNKEITDMITEAYRVLGGPMVSCTLGSNKSSMLNIVEGFQARIALADNIYVNSDDNEAVLNHPDILIFENAIGSQVYNRIIKPLQNLVRTAGRQLVIIAPNYDQNTLYKEIRRDIMIEYERTKKLSLVLLIVGAMWQGTKTELGDLAMLLNTELITRYKEADLFKLLETEEVMAVFNINKRSIPGLDIAVKLRPDDKDFTLITDDGVIDYNTLLHEDALRVGHVDKLRAGFEKSVFSGFHYDKSLFDKVVREAEGALEEAKEKIDNMGQYQLMKLNEYQRRVNSLSLKMAHIEVGGESRFSQNLLKDSVDDSIRAAESAYNYGYILGCNVTTLGAISDLYMEVKSRMYPVTETEHINQNDLLDSVILNSLYLGFMEVYSSVIKNWNEDNRSAIPASDFLIDYGLGKDDFIDTICNKLLKSLNIDYNNFDKESMRLAFCKVCDYESVYKSLFDLREKHKESFDKSSFTLEVDKLLIAYSVITDTVFDITTAKPTKDIINSARTDIEVVTAVVDLMSILFNGNQMVLLSTDQIR